MIKRDVAYQLVEGDLRTLRVKHEPPGVAEYGGAADVGSNDHVSEEEPAADERLSAVSGGHSHNRVVGRIEAESGSGKTVGDQVHPEQLNWDESLGHA